MKGCNSNPCKNGFTCLSNRNGAYVCECNKFSNINFNQKCICGHSYKIHNITISDWMIQIYNIDKITKKNIIGDFCNIGQCKKCKCDKFNDNLINDKCEKCTHNVLNHCNTYSLIY